MGREENGVKGREAMGREGKNMLPHSKQAVAAYGHMPESQEHNVVSTAFIPDH